MNSKTAARMKHAARVFGRLATTADREIRRLEKIKHLKPEDFAAAVKLREISDLCKKHAATVSEPAQRELIAS